MLLPLLDLINHADDDAANAVVGREGASFVARTIKDVAAGEEVRRADRGSPGKGCGGCETSAQAASAEMRLKHVRTPYPRVLCSSPHARTSRTFLRTYPTNVRTNASPSQVRFSYSNGNARNDHALQHYGFLARDRAADPLLCCVDEPGGNLWNCPDPGAGLLDRVESMNEQGRLKKRGRVEA